MSFIQICSTFQYCNIMHPLRLCSRPKLFVHYINKMHYLTNWVYVSIQIFMKHCTMSYICKWGPVLKVYITTAWTWVWFEHHCINSVLFNIHSSRYIDGSIFHGHLLKRHYKHLIGNINDSITCLKCGCNVYITKIFGQRQRSSKLAMHYHTLW